MRRIIRRVAAALAGAVLAALVPAAALATVVVQLGTAGRAAAWSGLGCGAVAAPLVQVGDGIGLAGSLITGGGRCLAAGGLVAIESFYLPAGAANIRLRVDDFEMFGAGELRLNGSTVRGEDDDAGEFDPHGPDGGAVLLLPGFSNTLSIAFGGGAVTTGASHVLLSASLSYDLPLAATSGSAAPAPEPPGPAVLLVGLAALRMLRTRRKATR